MGGSALLHHRHVFHTPELTAPPSNDKMLRVSLSVNRFRARFQTPAEERACDLGFGLCQL